jgi:hypothetical protein
VAELRSSVRAYLAWPCGLASASEAASSGVQPRVRMHAPLSVRSDELDLALLIGVREAMALASGGVLPRGGVATGKLGGELVQVVVPRHRPSEPGGDPDGEGVAADTGQMLAEQVKCSRDVARGRSGDQLDVMAFPVHRPATGMAAWCTGDGLEIGGGEGKVRVGGDSETQGHGGPGRVGGSLRPPVPRGRLRVGSDHPAVVLDRGPGGGQMITVAGALVWRWRHNGQVARTT